MVRSAADAVMELFLQLLSMQLNRVFVERFVGVENET